MDVFSDNTKASHTQSQERTRLQADSKLDEEFEGQQLQSNPERVGGSNPKKCSKKCKLSLISRGDPTLMYSACDPHSKVCDQVGRHSGSRWFYTTTQDGGWDYQWSPIFFSGSIRANALRSLEHLPHKRLKFPSRCNFRRLMVIDILTFASYHPRDSRKLERLHISIQFCCVDSFFTRVGYRMAWTHRIYRMQGLVKLFFMDDGWWTFIDHSFIYPA